MVAAADLNGDSALTVADLALMSQEIIYDDGTFKLVEADALQMQAAMNAGVVTSVQLTKAYLARIAAYDRTVQPGATQPLNSIITTSSVALAAAAESDAARAVNHGPRSLLDGIPIVLKDNYDTKDMPTTAGCSCWAQNQTTDDSFMAKGLRAAHAIVLAKASMDEFAINTSSTFSFGSPAGSSLNVYSPYRPTGTSSTSGGSSGGTGASVAANLAALGFGTDTGGSIRVPSSYNQLVGLRPTVGLTSRSGIVPLALSQDAGGPLARSVTDVAIALDAVVGTDPDDPATAAASANVPATYTAFLDKNGLQGKRIGYDPSMVGTNATVVRLFDAAEGRPRGAGRDGGADHDPDPQHDPRRGERQHERVQPRPEQLRRRTPQPRRAVPLADADRQLRRLLRPGPRRAERHLREPRCDHPGDLRDAGSRRTARTSRASAPPSPARWTPTRSTR